MEHIGDIEDELGAFSLEDAHENLKDIQAELQREIDELAGRMAKNDFGTLSKSVPEDEVKSRYHRLTRGLLENLHHRDPRVLPLANTVDLYKTIVQDFAEVESNMEKIITDIETDIEKTRKNIVRLESKKAGLETMKNACQEAVENVGTDPTYSKGIAITKKVFNEVKADLYTCVDMIFPDNAGYKVLLADLTQAYTRGGDDVYINVEPENLAFAKYLVEADMAVYHRNDKTKIKMTDLL